MSTNGAAFEAVTEAVDVLGESPVWRDDTLHWVDIRAPALCRLDAATGTVRRFRLPDLCGGVALTNDARLVLALRTGLAVFDPATERVTSLLQPEPASLDNRLNESRCDRRELPLSIG